MDTSTLCSYCSATMQIQMSTVIMEGLHSTLQHSMVSLTFLRYYLSIVQRLIHRMNTNVPHFSWHHKMDIPMLSSYCSTTMQIQMSAVIVEELYSTLQQMVVTLTSLRYSLSVVWRLMHGTNTNPPHFSWHQKMDTLILCCYCLTTMQMWKHVTM